MGVWHEINVSCIVEHYLFYEINEIYEILFGGYGDVGPGFCLGAGGPHWNAPERAVPDQFGVEA